MTPLEILNLCLAKEDGRYCMSKPFRVGPHVYATDQRIMGRTMIGGVGTPYNPNTHPPIGALSFDAADYHAEPTPIPTLPALAECETCGGLGSIVCGCPHCSEEHDCEDCNGRGTKYRVVRLTDRFYIAEHYARKLLAFGAALYLPKIDNGLAEKHRTAKAATRWTAGEVEGLLMGIDPDSVSMDATNVIGRPA